jgi:hypothetical protein
MAAVVGTRGGVATLRTMVVTQGLVDVAWGMGWAATRHIRASSLLGVEAATTGYLLASLRHSRPSVVHAAPSHVWTNICNG